MTHAWWGLLAHGGMLIAPARLPLHFPDAPPPPSPRATEALRSAVVRALDEPDDAPAALLDTVLELLLGLEPDGWRKGAAVGPEWGRRALTGETVKPRRVWQGEGLALPVFVADGVLGGGQGRPVKRLGVGRGRRPVSRVVSWLRQAERPLALLTNGRQWRLVAAGADWDAWCEWDVDLWFEEGRPAPQVTALRALLGRPALCPGPDGARPPLLAAIQDSRRGQGELSAVLGERVRQAVEALISAYGDRLDTIDAGRGGDVPRAAMYAAATRIVMRCVVIAFAEARGDELLPRANPQYFSSYSLQGLREQLERGAGGRGTERLRHRHGAWPRLLALFRLIQGGSPHPDLPVPAYGGALFQPGRPDAADPLLRALTVLEDPAHGPDDAVVHRVLTLLSRSKVRVRQGRAATWVEAPVDFSDLSTEYIGILYEGLLDFELRRAEADDPVVFLNVGDQPALPLSRLEAMDDKTLRRLLARLGQVGQPATEAGDEDQDAGAGEDEELAGEGDDEAETTDGPAEEDEGEPEGKGEEDEAGADDGDDPDRAAHERVTAWARRAVEAAGLVRRPRGKPAAALAAEREALVHATARRLVARVVLPDQWYLVRWGGTRKGSGTFYTRPQLAGPTTQRTLRPLAYEAAAAVTDLETGLERVTAWAPRTPEVILGLKVCDPAMGSGSFLIAAVRFLTDALVESLHAHGRLQALPDGAIARLADGRPAQEPWDEPLPVATDHPEFEDRLRARLKRHVVERCIYGVDIDPLAVELAKLALWIETLDRSLPFGFLDHRLKVGDSLVGCWFDRFQDYPALAWERDGGDAGHDRFVHHWHEVEVTRGKRKGRLERRGDPWSYALKSMRAGPVRDELVGWVNAGRDDAFPFLREGYGTEAVHHAALEAIERVQRLPLADTEGRRLLYREAIERSPEVARLRDALDTWCAVWFWPGDLLARAPTPRTFADPPPDTLDVVRRVAAERRFFHWELEFPDVFCAPGAGFHAVVGNPPWETLQPESKEFFSNLDPLYRAYGKQEALGVQVALFGRHPETEREWIDYLARYAAVANWCKHAAHPWGDPEDDLGQSLALTRSRADSLALHAAWRRRRAGRTGNADPRHGFRHQGAGKAFTYRLFVEQAHALLAEGGRLGLVVPSGVYTDKGSTQLRQLFLDEARWEWLFGFENRLGIFPDVDGRFKFGPLVVQKGGRTTAIRAAFMRHDLDDWATAERHAVAYPRSRVDEFSPRSRSILEIRERRDLEILHKMYAGGVLLGDDGPDGWGIQYRQGDFNMTSDSHLFPPRPWWEERGYHGDEYGHWLKGHWRPYDGPTGVASVLARPGGQVLSQDGQWAIDVDDVEDVALPLYQGVMIGQFDPVARVWESGTRLGAVWSNPPRAAHPPSPQYLMATEHYLGRRPRPWSPRIGYRGIARTTDTRTWISTPIPHAPSGHSVFLLEVRNAEASSPFSLAGVLNSLVFDGALRTRFGGTNLSWFVVEETCHPRVPTAFAPVTFPAMRMAAVGACWSALWHLSKQLSNLTWTHLWALTPHERLRLRCMLDAIVAELYGLDCDDLAYILRDCDHPVERSTSSTFTRALDPKGFWRVDKAQPPELRHTVLSLVAFAHLKDAIGRAGGHRDAGIAAFCDQHDGDGWMLPHEVRLADYGLGHDARASTAQPVRSAMGERFLPWQLEMSVEESWEACRRHADLIGRIVPWSATDATTPVAGQPERRVAEAGPDYERGGGQIRMFEEDG